MRLLHSLTLAITVSFTRRSLTDLRATLTVVMDSKDPPSNCFHIKKTRSFPKP